MAEPVRRTVTVVNSHGLHARPSHAVVTTAARFDAEVWLEADGRRADARSILSVMTLGATRGTRILIEARGPEAAAAAEALAALFHSGFQEEVER